MPCSAKMEAMTGTPSKRKALAEAQLAALRQVRGLGGASGGMLRFLTVANASEPVCAAPKPTVFPALVTEDHDAGRPNSRLHGRRYVQRGELRRGKMPERRADRVKPEHSREPEPSSCPWHCQRTRCIVSHAPLPSYRSPRNQVDSRTVAEIGR